MTYKYKNAITMNANLKSNLKGDHKNNIKKLK